LITFEKKRSYVSTLLTGLALFCIPLYSFSQGLTPQQQGKVDSLMHYISKQAAEGKIPDQKYIDSVNTVIRSLNPVNKPIGSLPGDTAKEITKQSMAGTSFTVPEGKQWTVKHVYVNDGGSYNIVVTSLKFETPYKPGEKLFAPSWTAEAELLNGDKSTFIYIFKIVEENFPSKK
jgi:hypothetical protein